MKTLRELNLPQRPEPDAPANTVGLNWNAYSGVQMTIYGRRCYEAGVKFAIESEVQQAQQSAEPVAFRYVEGDRTYLVLPDNPYISQMQNGEWTPLYATPQSLPEVKE